MKSLQVRCKLLTPFVVGPAIIIALVIAALFAVASHVGGGASFYSHP